MKDSDFLHFCLQILTKTTISILLARVYTKYLVQFCFGDENMMQALFVMSTIIKLMSDFVCSILLVVFDLKIHQYTNRFIPARGPTLQVRI